MDGQCHLGVQASEGEESVLKFIQEDDVGQASAAVFDLSTRAGTEDCLAHGEGVRR